MRHWLKRFLMRTGVQRLCSSDVSFPLAAALSTISYFQTASASAKYTLRIFAG